MGKRKPTVPRRRVGTNFADLTVHRTAYIGARRSSDSGVGANVTAEPNGSVWPPAASAADGSTTGASSSAHPSHVTMPPTHQSGSTADSPHRYHAGKSTAPTVPLRPRANGDHDYQPPQETNEDTVTMTVADLESWKQRTIMQIEDHFTNEQLKRIAEFGRVHANLVKEAKEYVASIETQLKEQFERERESLTRQAEAYVAQFQQENNQLRERVRALEDELEDLRQDDEYEEEEEEMEATDVEEAMIETAPAEAVEAMDAASPPIPDISLDGMPVSGGDSTDNSSMASHSPDPQIVDKQSGSATRVDAVAETMQRAMEIRTPRVTSPIEDAMRRSTSPATTNEGSPIGAIQAPRGATTKESSTLEAPLPEN